MADCTHGNPYAWHAWDGTLCLACTICGDVLKGGVALNDPEDDTEIERDALAAWNQALDERAFDAAEVARLEVLAAQREAMTSADEIPF